MAINKSELYSSLWRSCDELRGGIDASQYKDYVLVLLFVKYVSDKSAGQKDARLDVPAGGSFADMDRAEGDQGRSRHGSGIDASSSRHSVVTSG
jgi:type I restriction enzyme M protein